MRLEFVIPGEPVPKGSRTVGARADGSRYTREASKRVKPWMDAAVRHISQQALRQDGLPMSGPVAVTAMFLCARPARPSHPYPTRGDADKMLRAGLDALTAAGAIVDDRHVTSVQAFKAFTDTDPRTVLWLEPARVPDLDLGAIYELVAA